MKPYLCFFAALTLWVAPACAQYDADRTTTGRYYTSQNREELKRSMQQNAQELKALAQDFKAFYGDLQQAVQESGIADVAGAQPAGEDGFGAYDIAEDGDDMVVRVDLPGVDKKDLSVKLVGSKQLVFSGRRPPAASEDQRVIKGRRHEGPFEWTLDLPYEAKDKNISAEYQNGVLTVRVPREPAPAKEIVEVAVR